MGATARLVSRSRRPHFEASRHRWLLVPSLDGTGIGFAPNPYVGFARTADEDFDWFPLDALPSNEELIAKGFRAGRVRMQTQGNASDEEFSAALAAKGITGFEMTSEEPPLTGQVRTEAVFTITHPEFLAVTKIVSTTSPP